MNGISVYQDSSVTTQSRGRLIVMLYDGAVKFLRQAVAAMENDTPEAIAEKGRCIMKAIAIIDELDISLELETGGQVAENLRSLYCFMRRHLSQAHIRSDANMVQDVIGLLEELNEAWRVVTI